MAGGRFALAADQMIVFGTCVGYPEKAAKYAFPGVQYSMRGRPYRYLAVQSNGRDIFPIYQSILETIRTQPDVEALVLLHDDLEIRDPYLVEKIRDAFSDPDCAILGAIGSRGLKKEHGINWWEAEGRGYAVDGRGGHCVTDFGFDHGRTHVDTVDGMFLGLSPWAIQHLSLAGKGYSGFHGYPEELCFQARAYDRLGKNVQVSRFELFHHTAGGIAGDPEGYIRSAENFTRRWFDR